MQLTTEWVFDGPGWLASEIGGDEQTGNGYAARYLCPELPGAVIDVHCYIIGHGTPERPWQLRWAAEYTLCTDTSRPGDTETWSTVIYRQWPEDREYRNTSEAASAAILAIQGFDASYLTWDGEPDVQELFPF